MTILKLYRIDQRTFAAGDAMPPPGDHMEDLEPPQQTAERILRSAAGVRERVRADLIFTFDSLDWTKRYFMGKSGRTVYELEVDEKDVVHSADMMYFNKIADINADTPEARAYAALYWQGDRGDGKRVEHLCAAARVKEVLFTTSDIPALKKELYDINPPDHGDEEFYENLFKPPKE
ncbi:DUF3841 domain-containing protein [Bradyrhizobium sp. NC92]|uniref:DUF3841 domain-containing protein n=1 Tax=Bradyrhizobium sp. (strain NC92) TaxID=55395 RepID=UPI0021AA56DD|nr:DUF3841 domain-containing protein [Bradyrhizobium sp. NC92]UWU66109.1 DUF3841 domain-containing protein [Bradyrhizobium sp. NC92]